jgi:hypothetical protein
MSFYSDASLVLIPSGYKDQKIYSAKPTDGSGDLTFSRASDATRVQSNGLIEKVRTNLLTYSEDFTNGAWLKTNASVTADATTAPNGTTTADKIVATAISANHFLTRGSTVLNGEHTFSVFAKESEYSLLRIVDLFSGIYSTTYNLSTGTASGTGAAIQNVGSGWYRCSVTFTSSGSTVQNGFIGIPLSSINYTGDGTSGIFVWGAQLETGVLTDYIPTTTAAVSVGPVSGLPRLDYLNSSCPRLLLEPQRTNLAQYSEQFDNVYWGKTAGTTLTANTTISPSGYQDADTAVFVTDTDSINKVIATGISVVSGTAYTFSVFTKTTTQAIFFGGATTGTGTNVYNGAVDYGNGWYRQSITRTWSASGTIQIQNTISPLTAGVTLQIWGAQLEAGAYATSYIPTLGTSVTRVADAASKTGISSLIGQTEGTLFFDVPAQNFGVSNFQTLFIIYNNAGLASKYFHLYKPTGGTQLRFDVYNTTVQCSLLYVMTQNTRYKIAAVYKNNRFELWVNGVLQSSDTVGTIGTNTYDTLEMAYDSFNSNSQLSLCSQALLFKTALTQSQLAELTTL